MDKRFARQVAVGVVSAVIAALAVRFLLSNAPTLRAAIDGGVAATIAS